jgi:phasin family protein
MNTANPLSEVSRSTLETTARAASISMEGAERTLAVQLEFARGALKQATANARAVSQVKDVQELMALRSRIAESTLESLVGYSRNLYEVASAAQSEFSRLAEERMGKFQKVVSQGVDEAAANAPAGSDFAVTAIKSQMAAVTAAFDTFNKAAKHLASFADAGVTASKPARSPKPARSRK